MTIILVPWKCLTAVDEVALIKFMLSLATTVNIDFLHGLGKKRQWFRNFQSVHHNFLVNWRMQSYDDKAQN